MNTYRQRHRQRHRWRIAGDCSVFFPYFVFAGDFLEGGGREEGEKESAGDGEEGEKESAGDGEGGWKKKNKEKWEEEGCKKKNL